MSPAGSPVPKNTRYWRLWGTSVLLLVLVASSTGCACAFFLWSLDAVTRVRFNHPWILALLPLGGWISARIYDMWGKGSGAGTGLILHESQSPSPGAAGIPRRMAPFILASTLLTHLLGGSAGREGTALQMGGGIAAFFLRCFHFPPKILRLNILAGLAAGFGGVFGTPFAGAVFAAEISRSRRAWLSLPQFLAAALLADATCHAWGIRHTAYLITPLFPTDQPSISELLAILSSVAAAGTVFGLGARLYVYLSKESTKALQKIVPSPAVRAFAGGCVVIALVWLAGTSDYLGLGVLPQTSESITLPSFFQTTEVRPWSWLWKLIFTLATLSSGFRGGEVTPLFFIGAGLGNALSSCLRAPSDLLSGLGLVALFGTAARTPLACWVMGLELFGIRQGIWLALACWVAFLMRGEKSLYDSDTESGLKPPAARD